MIKAIILHHNFIKISSCIIGYTIWAFIAQYQTMTITATIPICFYQSDNNVTISAPDSINLSLSGKRKHLYLFDIQNTVIHIDASLYKQGKHLIPLSRENLFLPDHIQLVQLKPSTIAIEIHNNTTLKHENNETTN